MSAQVNALCDRFKAAWKAEQRPEIEEFLDQVPEPSRGELFYQLLLVDLHWRVQPPGIIHAEMNTHGGSRISAARLRRPLPRICGLARHRQQPYRPGEHLGARQGLHLRCPHCHNPVEVVLDKVERFGRLPFLRPGVCAG